MTHMTEDMSRWVVVQAVLVRALLSAPFKKKLKAASWADTEAVLKEERTFPPMRGMSSEVQRGMLAVAVHLAWKKPYTLVRSRFATGPHNGNVRTSKWRPKTTKRSWTWMWSRSCSDPFTGAWRQMCLDKHSDDKQLCLHIDASSVAGSILINGQCARDFGGCYTMDRRLREIFLPWGPSETSGQAF